jgi:phospholipid-binding lipoprotein MlaA
MTAAHYIQTPKMLQIMKLYSLRAIMSVAALALLAACSVPPSKTAVYDPDEAENRKVHNFNKALDSKLVAPIARGYGATVPLQADRAISNVAENLAIPGEIVNSFLQFNMEDVVTNTIRFATNTILGVGGIFDTATFLGMEEDVDTDFGETLAVYGFPEGKYLEVPVYGPRTERETYGIVVDFFLDPVGNFLPSDARKVTFPLYVVDKVGDRNEYDDAINGILYESEDSYVAARSLYLQNRRFKIGSSADNLEDLEDPYAD